MSENIESEETTVFYYVAVIVKYRRMILRMCGAAVIIAVAVSFLLPEIYSATAVIMPPKGEKTVFPGLEGSLGSLAGLARGMMGVSNSADLCKEMLESRTVLDILIKQFNLLEIYDVEKRITARKVFKNNTNIKVSKANTISITVEDQDPKRAAELANAYVEELDKLSQKLTISDAARQREFLENRIKNTKQQLALAETKLKKFQEKNKIVALSEQARVSIEGAARIKGQIIGIEIELEVLKGFITGKSNKMVRLEQKLVQLKEQMAKIESGPVVDKPNNTGNSGEDSNFYIPFTQVPELGLQLAKLMREVKIHEAVFELLTQQYELARITESKDIATIQILDRAVVPEKRSKPKRMQIVILSGLITFVVSVLLAFIYNRFDKMNPGDKKRWLDMKADIKGNILFTRKEDEPQI